MNRYAHRLRIALAVILVAASASRTQAEAEDIYAGMLRGSGLILTSTGSGTGWVIDYEQRLMVTNEHVVTNNAEVDVVFPQYDEAGRPVAEVAHYIQRA